MKRRPIVVGNWKMHGTTASNAALLAALAAEAVSAVDVGVCAPFPYLAQCRDALSGSAVCWGAQDVSAHAQGAYTGEVSAAMLADFSCAYVLVGHSERRQYHAESSALVAGKMSRALDAGLTPIVCFGETLEERESGRTEAVVGAQLEPVLALGREAAGRAVLAYEPVWAIGTGKTATPAQAQAVHAFVRARAAAALGAGSAEALRIQYGGSVKAANAAELFAQADIDGGLIGGAALVAAEFVAICRAAAVAATQRGE